MKSLSWQYMAVDRVVIWPECEDEMIHHVILNTFSTFLFKLIKIHNKFSTFHFKFIKICYCGGYLGERATSKTFNTAVNSRRFSCFFIFENYRIYSNF